MDINRKTAYEVLLAIEVKKQYSNIALNNFIKKNKPENPAFVREIVYGVLENKKYLDFIISKLIKGKLRDVRSPDLVILEMGVYQLMEMNSVPDYAALDESVRLAKKFAKGRDKFINGVLRSLLRDLDLQKGEDEKISKRSLSSKFDLPSKSSDPVKHLSIKYSYEPWIVELWLKFYDIDFVEELLKAGNMTPPVSVRVNLTKTTKKALQEKLENLGFEVTDNTHIKTLLYVKGEGILGSEPYKNGEFSVQDEASQLLIETLQPQKTDFVIDVCAAPGGKSLAAAEMMANSGEVLSMDIYEQKVETIKKEAVRLGIKNIETKVSDATVLQKELVNKAHKVIVDVPCFGLGVIRRKPEIKYKKYDEQMKLLPIKQLEILETACQYVRKDGILAYSTCSINPYENTMVVDNFLEKHKEFQIEATRELFPNIDNTDGFYICIMRRKAKADD